MEKDTRGGMFRLADKVVFTGLHVVSYISGICLVVIMLVAFFNVLGEKLFKSGIPMSTEIIQYFHIPVVFLAAAYVTLDHGHTRIDLLSSHFPKALQQICAVLGDLLGIFICGFISYRGFVQMARFIARHKTSSVSGMSFDLWPFALIMAIGFALMAFSFFWSILRRFFLPAEEPADDSAVTTGGGE